MFLQEIDKFESRDCNQIDRLLMSLSVFRWYIVEKASREENLIFIVRVDITSNLEYLVAFSNKDVQIVLSDVLVFFRIHNLKKSLLLKIVDLIMIHRRCENYFRKFSSLDCSDFLHLAQKFDSSTFLIQQIEFTLQSSVIRSFECFDRLRAEHIECFVHRKLIFSSILFSSAMRDSMLNFVESSSTFLVSFESW